MATMNQLLVAQIFARHQIPKTTVIHPKNVIVPGDKFLTMKLKDTDYVPYCLKTQCGRVHRTPWGFECPTCGNKMNYDLTHYNGNINVQYHTEPPSNV